jgi:hypothetical protein
VSFWTDGRRRWAQAAALLLALGLGPGAATAAEGGGEGARTGAGGVPTVAELARCLATDGRVERAFREERRMPSVDETLTSRGRFVFEPPARLVKIVEAPRRERAVIAGGRMSVFDADGNEVAAFDLSERPGLERTFTAVRALLTGDAEALRAAFTVEIAGRGDARGGWRMTLEPRGEAASYELSRILVTGADCRVARIDVRPRGGGGRRVIHLGPGSGD